MGRGKLSTKNNGLFLKKRKKGSITCKLETFNKMGEKILGEERGRNSRKGGKTEWVGGKNGDPGKER